MILRVVVAVACSLVAITFSRLKGYCSRNNSHAICSEPRLEKESYDGKEICSQADAQEAQEEEVKHISVRSPALSSKSSQESEQLLLPEIDNIFQGTGHVDFPSDSEKSVDFTRLRDASSRLRYESGDSTDSRRYESNSEDDEALEVFEALTSSNKKLARDFQVDHEVNNQASTATTDTTELLQLKVLVADLQQKEMKLQKELLEYYGLKEQERTHTELRRQLRKKYMEIEKLNGKLSIVEERKRVVSSELAEKEAVKEELEAARAKIKDLQKVIQSNASQTKAQLLVLKQQVIALQEREQEASRKDFAFEKKLQTLKELEVEVVELRRKSKELQHQKRELTIQFAAAEAKTTDLSNVTESELVARAQAEASALKLANDDLSKQVEGLQINRFSEVEELVYLRWVNACLRYELQNYQALPGKLTGLDLGKNLSPRSQERAKQLMMEYVGPNLLASKVREKGDNDFDSVSSAPSTPSEYDFDEAFFESHLSCQSTSKKSGLIKKLKKWGKSKDEPQLSPATSLDLRSPLAHRHSSKKGPLESLMLRNNSDSVAITTYGTNDSEDCHLSRSNSNAIEDSLEKLMPVKTTQNGDMKDSASDVAGSFQLMRKSFAGVIEEKYPAFKDRHKLAVAREKALKEKADHARAEKLSEKLKADPSSFMEKENKFTPEKISEKLRPDRLLQRGADIVSANDSNPEQPEINKRKLFEFEKRAPRVPRPPPKASVKDPAAGNTTANTFVGLVPDGAPPPPPMAPGAPPPPPPPPGNLKLQAAGGEKVQRVPEVVEFYQSLMRREAKKDTSLGVFDPNVSDARNNLIGEIENRSAFLLAVKADVETQGDFVQSLAVEVRDAVYIDMEGVIAFVSWLDEELSFLVDERAVLKHFDWPENKADAMREAAFEYQDLIRLEVEVTLFKDDLCLPCEASLKKMVSVLEKVEQSVYALLRTRDMAIARYKEFNIPTNWMLDSGLVGKMKLATVQLARTYMKRVAAELDASTSSAAQDPLREFLLLQGVRFAFRVHQFAGGFDTESMRTFEELRDRVRASAEQPSNGGEKMT